VCVCVCVCFCTENRSSTGLVSFNMHNTESVPQRDGEPCIFCCCVGWVHGGGGGGGGLGGGRGLDEIHQIFFFFFFFFFFSAREAHLEKSGPSHCGTRSNDSEYSAVRASIPGTQGLQE